MSEKKRKRAPGAGRPRKTPGQYSEGQPKISCRVDERVKAWVDSQGPRWLYELVMAKYHEAHPT